MDDAENDKALKVIDSYELNQQIEDVEFDYQTIQPSNREYQNLEKQKARPRTTIVRFNQQNKK